MKDVQCYELFGGIAHKNHAFSFFFIFTIGNAQIPIKQSVKNLGFTLDCYHSMNAHVSNIA